MILNNQSILFLFSVILFLCSPLLSANDFDEYHIRLNKALTQLQIKACFKSNRPKVLRAGSKNAANLVLKASVEHNGSEQILEVSSTGIKVKQLSQQGCLDYQVDFDGLKRLSNSGRIPIDLGNSIATLAGDWLWLPDNPDIPIRARFSLPEGMRISAPWHLLGRTTEKTVFELDMSDSLTDSQVYIGHFALREIEVEVNGAKIRLAIMGNPDAGQKEKITRWIRYGAESIVALYGYYPLSAPQLVVFRIGPYDSAVPWGEVQRDGGCVANLYVDQTRPLTELIKDWTLIHELTHMIHPYLDMSGRWLTEGIATYYQNLLQAGVGTLTEKQAWLKLHQGFQRGIKEAEPWSIASRYLIKYA